MRTPFRIGSALVFGLLLSWVSRVHGQAIIYNANGFEPPTFTTGVPPNPLAGYNASQTPGGQGREPRMAGAPLIRTRFSTR
jgi:hypothetical protein